MKIEGRHLYVAAVARFIINGALLFTPLTLPRTLSAICILFLTPGVFITRIFFPAQEVLEPEGLLISMLTSIACNILLAFGLNVLANVPLTNITILAMCAGMTAVTIAVDMFLSARRPAVPPQKIPKKIKNPA